MDFVAFDFETATGNLNSVCSVGIALVHDLHITGQEYYLVRPPALKFDDKNIAIHGITPEMVGDAPEFPGIWQRIKGLFDGGRVVVAHNAAFDVSVLKETLGFYGIEWPRFPYLCSIELSDRVCGTARKNLAARADYFGIEMGTHHNARDDAAACAQIVIASVRAAGFASVADYLAAHRIAPKDSLRHKTYNPFSSNTRPKSGYRKFESLDLKAVNAVPTKKETPLTGANVVLTGNFHSHSKNDLAMILSSYGAVIKSGVSTKTNVLVVGTQDKSIVGEDGLSGKEEKAYQLIEAGHEIMVLTEEKLLLMIEGFEAL